MGKSDLHALFTLSVAERIELVEELWDSVAEEAQAQALAPHELSEIQLRLREHRAAPGDVVAWEVVKNKLGLSD